MHRNRKEDNRIHTRISVFLLLIFTCAIVTTAEAIDYYVDQNNPAANDQNPGTIAQPWESITRANQVLAAGDIVNVKGGTYTSYIAPNNSGTCSKPIIYYDSDNECGRGEAFVILMGLPALRSILAEPHLI